MDLINWSINAIDYIFSTQKNGQGDPSCPDGTFPSGYVIDPWSKWSLMCLPQLSIEDVEDVYIFGFMVVGFLMIGLGGFLAYRKASKCLAACGELPDLCEGMSRGIKTLNAGMGEMNRKLDATLALHGRLQTTYELMRKMDSNLERIEAQLEGN